MDTVTSKFETLHSYLVNKLACKCMWEMKGPKDTHIKAIHCYYQPHTGNILMVQEFKDSDGWNIFGEIGRTASIKHSLEDLHTHLGGNSLLKELGI